MPSHGRAGGSQVAMATYAAFKFSQGEGLYDATLSTMFRYDVDESEASPAVGIGWQANRAGRGFGKLGFGRPLPLSGIPIVRGLGVPFKYSVLAWCSEAGATENKYFNLTITATDNLTKGELIQAAGDLLSEILAQDKYKKERQGCDPTVSGIMEISSAFRS